MIARTALGRRFILGGAAALLMPHLVRAQEAGRIYRLGIVSGTSRTSPNYLALFAGLARLGFV
jgi:hypothetical protein